MIWGETYKQRSSRMHRQTKYFAWWPVQLDDGRWAWIEKVMRTWWEDEATNWAGDDSCWKYSQLTLADLSR